MSGPAPQSTNPQEKLAPITENATNGPCDYAHIPCASVNCSHSCSETESTQNCKHHSSLQSVHRISEGNVQAFTSFTQFKFSDHTTFNSNIIYSIMTLII
jgi:hypothetical protein